MSSRSLGQLTLDLIARTGSFEQGMDKAERKAKKSGKDMAAAADQASSAWSKLGPIVSTALAGIGAGSAMAAIKSAMDEQEQLQRNLLRTEAIVKSTGAAAGFSAEQLHEQARQLALATLGSTEGIMEAQQVMLTFRKVTGDTFTRAIELAGDLATVTGGNLRGSVTQLGKALEDPVKGINALSRSGVSFTQAQKDLIKSLAETGDIAAAQKIILDELAQQYGGVSRREAEGLAGAQDTLGQRIQEAKLALADQLQLSERAAAGYNALADVVLDLGENMDVVIRAGEVVGLVIGSRVVAATGAASAAFVVGQVEAMRYQASLARMAGVSATTATGLTAMAGAARVANGALMLVGGPVGAAVLAAGALYLFRDELTLSGRQATNTEIKIGELTDGIDDMNQAMLETRVTELTLELAKLEAAAETAAKGMAEAMRADTGVSSFGSITQLARAAQAQSEITTETKAHNEALAQTQAELDKILKLKGELGRRPGGGGGDDDNDKETARRIDAIKQEIAALEQQAATVGMAADAVTLFKLEQQGATEAQLAQARAALEVVAAHKAQEDYKQLLLDLRTEEEKLTDQLHERLAVLDKIRNLPPEEREKAVGRIADAAFEDAPEFAGLSSEIGGPFGELAKIDDAETEQEDWYARQLEMLEQYRAEKAELSATWDAKELALKQEHEDQLAQIERARQLTQLAAAESTFGDLASIAKTFAGEESGVFKALFLAEKAFSIARSIMAIQTGIAQAAALPFPANIPAMASVAAATAGIVSTISSVAMPSGMAHDGIDSIPEDGTWFLQKGERVTTAQTSDKLDRTLEQIRQGQHGGGGGAPVVNVTLIEDNSRAGQVDNRQNDDGSTGILVFVSDIRSGGERAQVLEETYGLQRRGR